MRILSVDGGGYLGLATATLLEVAEHDLGGRCSERFDLFCGTSTGAIIALALAAGKTAQEVAALYEELGPKIFPAKNRLLGFLPSWALRLMSSAYDNELLKDSLTAAFGDLTLGDLRANHKRALVTAFCLTSGKPRVFKTDHASGLVAHDRYLLRDIALASSAAPSYLPIVSLRDPVQGIVERFIDGGVFANSPALLGYAEAVKDLKVDPRDIAILSLSTPRSDHAERASSRHAHEDALNRGLFHWRNTFPQIVFDSSVAITGTALKRITEASGARYERVELSAPRGVGLDLVSAKTTETLRQLGIECGHSEQVRSQLRPFFNA